MAEEQLAAYSPLEAAALAMARWDAQESGQPIPEKLSDTPKGQYWRAAALVGLTAARMLRGGERE